MSTAISKLPDSYWRLLLTVNSTYDTALAGSDAALNPRTSLPESLFTASTTAADAGRLIDIGRDVALPYVGTANQLGPASVDPDSSQVVVPTGVELAFIGTDASNETFTIQVLEVSPACLSDSAAASAWYYSPLCALDVTLGADGTGVADTFFADTIALIANSGNVDYTIYSGSAFADYPIGARIRLKDVNRRYLYIRGTRNGKTAASFNVLWRPYS